MIPTSVTLEISSSKGLYRIVNILEERFPGLVFTKEYGGVNITHGGFDDLYVQLLWRVDLGYRIAYEQSPETDEGDIGCVYLSDPQGVLNMVINYIQLQMSLQ